MRHVAHFTAIIEMAPCGLMPIMAALLSTNQTTASKWQEQPDFSEPALSIEGAGDHWNHREDYDYYPHPRVLFHQMTSAQRQVLFENTARFLGGTPRGVQLHRIGNCTKADPAYGAGIAKALGIKH